MGEQGIHFCFMRIYKKSKWVRVHSNVEVEPEVAWKVLTEPELIQKYMFNCQFHSNWEVGSDAIWKEQIEDGSFVNRVTAKILIYDPLNRISFQVYHKRENQEPDTTELIFRITPVVNGIYLDIVQGNFDYVSNGEKLFEECEAKWDLVLPKLVEVCYKINGT